MDYEIRHVEVTATTIASTRARGAWPDLATAIRAMLDRVHAFLRTAPLAQKGRNVVLYRSPGVDGVDLEVGVQVTGPFTEAGDIRASSTPAGRAGCTTHRGPYEQLPMAHDALVAWCKDDVQGPSWEVYGDWNDDPAQRLTEVYILLKPR